MRRNSVPIPGPIVEQASDWLVALREPGASAEVRGAFADWLRISPLHVRAYLEVAELWVDAAQVRKEFPIRIEGDDAEGDVLHLPVVGRLRSPYASAVPRSSVLRWTVASFLIVALACGLIAWQLGRQTYSAALGTQRVLALEDGSVVRLNSRARVRVRFSKPRREIELLEGQAFFEVAKDPARPFIVRSGRVAVRAVGTEFDVFHKSRGMLVTVVNGRVEVSVAREVGGAKIGGLSGDQIMGNTLRSSQPGTGSPVHADGQIHEGQDTGSGADSSGAMSAAPRAQVLPLSAGGQIAVTGSGRMESNDHANIAAATSWLRHELFFDDATLDDVVEEFNQYTRRRIVVTDPALAALRISAVFHSTQADSFLRYVRRLPGVDVQESLSEVRISRRPAP